MSRVRIAALRCLRDVELHLDPARNYIFGPNGAGKTSLLEGMFVLGRGRSFRTRQIRRLVRHGEDGFAVFGVVTGEGAGARQLGVAYRDGHLEKRIDGRPAAGMAELAEILPVHALDPSMHSLVEGGPSERRRFLDWGVFHVEHSYLEAWKRYRRVLSQRNAALKRSGSADEIEPWSAELVATASVVEGARSRYVSALAGQVALVGQALLERPLTLDYRRGWPEDEDFEEALSRTTAQDREQGTTTSGPHRAELVLRLEGRRAQDEASRGQQKLTAAALILAQVAVESAARPLASLVVVDDPAAELDAPALERLLAAMADLRAQLVFTALTPSQLPITPGRPVFHVEQGEVRTV